eukprot:m.53081 g.53081  ORF g.53081 m.53081 type:complete len:271 (+) comp12349_c0_seq2:101-913(+)
MAAACAQQRDQPPAPASPTSTPVGGDSSTDEWLITCQEWNVPAAEEVKAELLEAWRLWTVDNAVTQAWFHRLADLYSEPTRHYHTLNHIWSMVQLVQQAQTRLQHPTAVGLATFFHDAIYDPKAPDNEEKSAELFSLFARECAEGGSALEGQGVDVGSVVDLILATKAHCTEVHRTAGALGADDVHWFLDFDMAVLGWPADAYQRYARQIRNEYQHVAWVDYCAKRPAVLRTFLQTPNIYATGPFRHHREAPARQNLDQEAERLTLQHTQ